jgi:hypothetical protein
MTDRYDTTGNPEDEYYPGTSVLINLEDIHDRISPIEVKNGGLNRSKLRIQRSKGSYVRLNPLAYFPWSPAFPAILTNYGSFRF